MGTCSEILRYGDKKLGRKTLITSTVTDEHEAVAMLMLTHLAIDVTPNCLIRWWAERAGRRDSGGTEILTRRTSSLDYQDIKELNIGMHAAPNGSCRNIRRFAFVIHPLSAEYIATSLIPAKLAGPFGDEST